MHLVIGPNHLDTKYSGIAVHNVRSAASMAKTCDTLWPSCDVAVLAAAVADFTPGEPSEQKIKKDASATGLTLDLKATKDIAKSLGQAKKEQQITVGFALETQDGAVNARKKLHKKNFDFIVLNTLQDKGAGFKHDTNKVTFIFDEKPDTTLPLKLKTEVAHDIVDQVEILAIEKKLIA